MTLKTHMTPQSSHVRHTWILLIQFFSCVEVLYVCLCGVNVRNWTVYVCSRHVVYGNMYALCVVIACAYVYVFENSSVMVA